MDTYPESYITKYTSIQRKQSSPGVWTQHLVRTVKPDALSCAQDVSRAQRDGRRVGPLLSALHLSCPPSIPSVYHMSLARDGWGEGDWEGGGEEGGTANSLSLAGTATHGPERMLQSGTDSESCITEYTSLKEDNKVSWCSHVRPCVAREWYLDMAIPL